VVHLACGLDSRALRLQEYLSRPGGGVRWVDVDFPDVVELRRKLLPSPEGDYQLVGASVNEDKWLCQIPADRPTVVVFEGLSMYLTPEQGRSLVERLTAYFEANGGQLLFDCLGWIAISLQGWNKAIQKTGSTLGWAIDDPKELETWHKGLKLKDDVLTCERPGTEELPLLGRVQMWVVARLPGFRYIARDLRYQF
jgi:O-methyltransferase involved in polyketide biosynthesis